MKTVFKILKKIVLIGLGVYAALFAVFFFDLDGKALFYGVEPFLCRDYDRMQEHNHTHVDWKGNRHHHPHHRSHEQTKAGGSRLSRAQGHLDAVRKMVERGEDCAQVLVQLSAVISALNGTGRAILKDHISHCIVDAVEAGDQEAIQSLNDAIDRFMR